MIKDRFKRNEFLTSDVSATLLCLTLCGGLLFAVHQEILSFVTALPIAFSLISLIVAIKNILDARRDRRTNRRTDMPFFSCEFREPTFLENHALCNKISFTNRGKNPAAFFKINVFVETEDGSSQCDAWGAQFSNPLSKDGSMEIEPSPLDLSSSYQKAHLILVSIEFTDLILRIVRTQTFIYRFKGEWDGPFQFSHATREQSERFISRYSYKKNFLIRGLGKARAYLFEED